MADEVKQDTITLPRSGFVLRKDAHPIFAKHGIHRFKLEILANEASLETERDSFSGAWRAEFKDGFVRMKTRDECIAWLDARVLELRAALLPPDARERIAKVMVDRGIWKSTAEDCAEAVLTALGGGA